MQTYLSLGSNLGDRRDNLRRAIAALEAQDIRVARVSPVVESPALLPREAPADWNLPFLNLVLDCEVSRDPEALRLTIKHVEAALGRMPADRWAPRPIDIDILLWGEESVHTAALRIPHEHAHLRSFVLTPLCALQPRLELPGKPNRILLDWSSQTPDHIPLWMGIINVTPDSFSDGGRFTDWNTVAPQIDAMLAAGVHFVDLGAESTRPGAQPLAAAEEWQRLQPVIEPLLEYLADDPLRPRLSVDTYHPETARQALRLGIDMINDVSGLSNPAMLELARDNRADWVAMHSLSLPVKNGETLPRGTSARVAVEAWVSERVEQWDKAGIDLNRVILDPGIGFGKDALQSLELLRSAGQFRRHGLRVLIGHSRKSFLSKLTGTSLADKDLATLGASLALADQRVDILRVHNVPMHAAAYRGWSHIRPEIPPDCD